MNAHEVISKYRDELKHIKTLSITGDNNKPLSVSFEKAIAELNSIIDGIDPRRKGVPARYSAIVLSNIIAPPITVY
jgi:hypothetical protein